MMKNTQQKERINPIQPTTFKEGDDDKCLEYSSCEYFMIDACDGCLSNCVTNTASER